MATLNEQDTILAALDKWRKTLVSFDGNNRQIFYRKKKLADVSFDDAHVDIQALEALLQGAKTRVSTLYPGLVQKIEVKEAKTDLSLDSALDDLESEGAEDPAKAWTQRLRRFEAVYRKTVEDEEEKNIQTCFVAEGFATWNPKQSVTVTPNAPLLLHPIKVSSVSKGNTDFSLEKNGPTVINEALALYLETEYGVPNTIFQLTSEEPRLREAEVSQLIQSIKEFVPGFKVNDEVILGNFAFLLYPMVMDLQRMMKMFISHPVLGLLAGAGGALEKMTGIGSEETLEELSVKNPIIENLVFPADASQHSAISAIMGGKNIVIQGPPGTGKSQTIANVIAECAASKKSVLFVAEKRAAIDAVVERLGQKGLNGIVLDLHGEPDKKTIAKNLTEVLKAYNVTREPSNSTIDKLLKAKQLLQSRWDWFNQSTSVSSYSGKPLKAHELIRELGIRATALDRSIFSYANTYIPDIEKIDTATRDSISERLDNLNHSQYFSREGQHKVTEEFASFITSEQQVLEVVDSILQLSALLNTREAQNCFIVATKFIEGTPPTPEGIQSTLDAYLRVTESVSEWKMDKYDEIVEKQVLFTSFSTYKMARGYGFIKALRERKREISSLSELRANENEALTPKEFSTQLSKLTDSVKTWEALGGTITSLNAQDPAVPILHDILVKINYAKNVLSKTATQSNISSKTMDELATFIRALQADIQYIRESPRINESLQTLRTYGIIGVLDFFKEKQIDFNQITDYWEYIWFDAHVRRLMITANASKFNSASLNDAIRDFRARDQEVFNANPGKILRRISESPTSH